MQTSFNTRTFPTLYSRASTGKPQQWTIIVVDDHYWTESGQVGGAITKSAPTYCKGKNSGKKNATTDHEQAMKDAQSKFDKQKKSGGYFESIEEIDNISFLQPMLAKNYVDRKAKLKWPMIVQCKFNGGRCIAKANGLWTRKGERIVSVPHIEEALKPLFDKHPDAYIDGELFNYNLRQYLNKLMKLIRRQVNLTEEHFKESKEKVKFYIYDGYDFGEDFGPKEPYVMRKAELDKLIKAIPYTVVVDSTIVNNEEELETEYRKLLEDEQEGCILRVPDSGYENDKRSWNLLKYKPVDDAEFLLLDVSEGDGDWADKAKIVHLQMDDGRKFNGSFKGTMEEAADFLANKHIYIGKKYTCYFNGFTGYQIPNYARFDYLQSVRAEDK
jgi:DNA ligase-1